MSYVTIAILYELTGCWFDRDSGTAALVLQSLLINHREIRLVKWQNRSKWPFHWIEEETVMAVNSRDSVTILSSCTDIPVAKSQCHISCRICSIHRGSAFWRGLHGSKSEVGNRKKTTLSRTPVSIPASIKTQTKTSSMAVHNLHVTKVNEEIPLRKWYSNKFLAKKIL